MARFIKTAVDAELINWSEFTKNLAAEELVNWHDFIQNSISEESINWHNYEQAEIGEAVGVVQPTVINWESEFIKISLGEELINWHNFEPPIYNRRPGTVPAGRRIQPGADPGGGFIARVEIRVEMKKGLEV